MYEEAQTGSYMEKYTNENKDSNEKMLFFIFDVLFYITLPYTWLYSLYNSKEKSNLYSDIL